MKSEFAEGYGLLEQWHWWFRGREQILTALLRRKLRNPTSLTIASVGCGPWQGLRWLEPFAAPHGRVVGVDVERMHAGSDPPRIGYVVGTSSALPLAAGAFDVVLALDVLEHLDDDAAGLREVARLTRPGGLLVVTVPALPSLWGRQDVVSHHRRRYTQRSLLAAFDRAGLPRPRVTYFNSLLLAPIAAVRWLRRSRGVQEETGSDFDDTKPGLVNDLLASIFSAERHLMFRIRFPVGVSLLTVSAKDED
jgi:SAM-dependent methyltransferase